MSTGGPRWKGKRFSGIAKAHPISSIIKQLQTSLLECTTPASLSGCNALLEVGPTLSDLLDRACFGHPIPTSLMDKQWFQLGPEEVFYLAHALNSLVIAGPGGRCITNDELWDHMRESKVGFPYLFKAYFHLRNKNWIVRPGLQYGVDFVAYRHHPALVHSEYAILVMAEGDSTMNNRLQTWTEWQCALRVSGGVAKTLLMLYIDGANSTLTSRSCLEHLSVEEQVITRWVPQLSREICDDDDSDDSA